MSSVREGLELWAAARTVAEHAAGSGCNRCQPHGCELYAKADLLLREWEQRHRQRYPGYAPSWQAAQRAGGLSGS